MNDAREAILLGTRGAADMHATFGLRERIEQRGGAIDVFGVIQELGVSLLFRPLDPLLGACIRLPDKTAGILVTTRRGLHMKRFTGAHELGHFALDHEGSLDREIRFPGQTANRDLNEVAADAFAAEFLMPKWLFIHHAKRHGWSTQQLNDPLCVYQLSLRMAVSYDATCLGLQAHKILTPSVVEKLRAVTPKKSKQRVLHDVEPEDWRGHVWQIDEHDDASSIEAGPNDFFVAELIEHSGSGYLWDVENAKANGFAVVADVTEPVVHDAVGGESRRRLVLRASSPGVHSLSFAERRPWETKGTPLRVVSIGVSALGPESEGLPRRARPATQQESLH
jgi:Zn-dependent peptidase ImmA (M78 family)